jgi:hypothetical protein
MSSLKKLWFQVPLGYPVTTYKVYMAIGAVNELWLSSQSTGNE